MLLRRVPAGYRGRRVYKVFLRGIIIGVHWKLISANISIRLINSLPPSGAHMRKWTGSALVQLMATRTNAELS